MPKWEAIMLYCTKCKSICEDSTQTCPNCKRSRGLRPVKPEDEVFFLKVSEGKLRSLRCSLSKTRCAMRYTP